MLRDSERHLLRKGIAGRKTTGLPDVVFAAMILLGMAHSDGFFLEYADYPSSVPYRILTDGRDLKIQSACGG